MLKALLSYIREHQLVRAGDRVGVAVSGGADSVALLRAMLALREKLGILLSVAHVHHGIRGAEAEADAEFVAALARENALALHLLRADVPAYAAEHGLSLEAAGRAVRYAYFEQLLSGSLDRLATAHTRDDQAETVLMRLVRGAGTRGLAGVYRCVDIADPTFAKDRQIWGTELEKSKEPTTPRKRTTRLSGAPEHDVPKSCIIRPLLDTTRAEIEAYLRQLGQPWREDATNADRAFLRNRVRHELLPVLERDFNSNIRQVLAQAAEVARDEEDWWAAEVARFVAAAEGGSFAVPSFMALHPALQRRLLRTMAMTAGEVLGFDAVERARKFVLGATAGTWPISGRLCLEVRRFRASGAKFSFQIPPQLVETQDGHYEYQLTVPGSVAVPEAGIRMRAVRSISGSNGALSGSLAGRTLTVRNWRAGDRFLAQGRRDEKKIKELFQIYRIPAAERSRWPVLECDGDIVWVRGLPPSEKWGARPGEEFSILLKTVPLSDPGSA